MTATVATIGDTWEGRLVEAMERRTILDDPHDYAPAQLTRYLKRYHELAALCDEVKAITYTTEPFGSDGVDRQWEYARIKRDLDKALLWLHQVNADPIAANYIVDHYVDGKLPADIADAEGISQKSVNRYISRGIDAMAEHLGWRRPLTDVLSRA